MKWVTRERPKTDRIACPCWLLTSSTAMRRSVPAADVLDVAKREGGFELSLPVYDALYAWCRRETLSTP
jgi:hypothetical protein